MKIVDEMPPVTRASRYPWDEWLDGQARLLEFGEDFVCTINGLRSAIGNEARRRGIKVITRTAEDGLYVQAIWPDDAA